MLDWPAPETAAEPEFRHGNLEAKFVAPPFSVLDTRQGYWQERRRAWLSLGIQSELGRGADLSQSGAHAAYNGTSEWAGTRGPAAAFTANEVVSAGTNGTGTSIFDPVLCELMYRWFAPAGGQVLDPFAGGSVRGIVASRLGHPYAGIDLSERQVLANRSQAEIICSTGTRPKWAIGDSRKILRGPGVPAADLLFSCPPYADLEVYSDHPADLSNMDWTRFAVAYTDIIAAACGHLRESRFAVFVVSEIRGTDGAYRGLVPLTIEAFMSAGLRYYNEAILVNSAGSLPLRVTKYMEASRKLGRSHQNVLVFLKGAAPNGWSYERLAPPEPQLALGLGA